ncbi:MAG: hypothetical protein IVW36_12195 [Dehalococcoidia bacterium]|nr:hypothetical protein [Dehalococcoidia bacterium]
MRSRLASFVLALLIPAALVPAAGAARAAQPAADFNGDCVVNGIDFTLLARSYLTATGSLLYRPAYDLNHDGVINIIDLQIFDSQFGQRC